MKIRVSTLPPTGMSIQTVLPLDPLNSRLKEGTRGLDMAFEAPPEVDLTLTGGIGGAQAKGVVIGALKQGCGSCADDVVHQLTAEISWVLKSKEDRKYRTADEDIDDPGVIFYDGDHVDLEDPLQEALIFAISPFWHPERNEAEECIHCGRNCSNNVSNELKETKESSSRSAPVGKLGALLEGAISGTGRQKRKG